MTVTAHDTGRWWRGRPLRVFLLLGIVAILLAGVVIDLWAGRRAAAEYARLEQRYGSLDGRSVEAPAVAPEYNSARFVRAAAVLTVPPRQPATYSSLSASFTRFEQLPPSSAPPDEVRAFVEANQDAIRVAGQARNLHQASWNADYGGGGYVPRWLEVRTLSNAIYFSALLDVKADQPDSASQTIAAGLAVVASIRHEPSLVPQLVRIAAGFQQCEAVKRLITHSEPSKLALEELARSLVENRSPDPLRVGLLAELRHMNTALMKMERGHVSDEFGRASIWTGPLARVGRSFVRLGRVHYLRQMERLIDIQAGPRPRPSFPEPSRLRFWDPRRLSAAMIPGLERAIDSGDQFSNVLGTTELGVALRRYRLDHGTYPEELSVLVPAYVSRLPIDTVTGRPPAYARTGAGFTLKAEAVRKDASSNSTLEWVVTK